MEQLLRISSTPISVEIEINRARLNYQSEFPKVSVTREDGGGLKMKADPIKINIDSFETRQSIGLKSNDTLIKEFADKGIKVAYQAIAQIAEEGDSLADPNGMTPAQIAASKISKSIETVLDFLPKEGPKITWDGGKLSIEYQMDKLDMNWDTNTDMQFEFVPGKIEFSVKQLPSVDIEYIGGPIYVPPSADPEYRGKEMDIKV